MANQPPPPATTSSLALCPVSVLGVCNILMFFCIQVCEGCPELEEIIIDQCAKLTNETLVHLGRHSRMLKYISATSITNITDEGVLALLQGCQQIQTLRLPLCGLTGQSVRYVGQHGTKITYLDIRGVTLEDNHIHYLVMSLTKVETLNLGLCFNLTDVSVTEIAKYFKKIKHLFLVNSKVTDEGIASGHNYTIYTTI